MNSYDLPYPIRMRSGGWEVVMVDGDSVWDYILCATREEAELVADARALNGLAMRLQTAEPKRVRRCIEALHRHGLDGRVLLVRRVMSLAS